jgi:ATP-dependent Clp protease, protease subunit
VTNGISPQQPQTPKEVYGYFVGTIDQQAVQRTANALTIATNNGVETVHMVFHSTGGMVSDGICLYNMFQNTNLNIHLYNAGLVASIGVMAFLGADVRKCTANAAFMIHKTHFSPTQATVERLQSATNAAILDDARIESILHEHITLSQEQWEVHKFADLWLSADDAVKSKLVTAIEDFYIPPHTQLFYLGPT